MLALKQPCQPLQVQGDTPAALGDALRDEVNLAIWRRQLPLHIQGFANSLLALGEPLAESLTLELADADGEPDLSGLARGFADLEGHAGFIADVGWLVRAFACLLEARRIGLRLRRLDKAMCPRFHVDHVPLRLITTYAGIGSQWLREGEMSRARLGDPKAEPSSIVDNQQLAAGHVALFKGEKWLGNEGRGIIHRSPQPAPGESRLLLTLDWLA
ncbi:DUF1826 domain-containing protein [Metapseudomonas furukawaii]|uniref:DUF1826 domain-containing protein n=1 Tax=Metapseudomonas furukawaii TaxID=1149133 RepID=A0AAD1C763_METFU|nr:DUF1826 domain-containing protein [Pseudomonas furukawaii]ELS29887.1 Hypothetical protein ppKF707_5429 [Pseudomonas furukawaii]BAU77364.1 hypothetical protein KF707C_56760 [Pseudomonas furukawaii]